MYIILRKKVKNLLYEIFISLLSENSFKISFILKEITTPDMKLTNPSKFEKTTKYESWLIKPPRFGPRYDPIADIK